MLSFKIKFILITISCGLFLKVGSAQNSSKAESLFQIQLEEYDDPKRIDLLITKASELKIKNADESILYYKFALELAENKGQLSKALHIAYQLADIFKLSNSLHYALKYYMKYGELASSIGDKRCVGVSYYYQGEIYFLQNSFEDAKHYYLKASELFKNLNCYSSLSDSYNYLGLLYYKTDLNKALEYYQKAYGLESQYGTRSKSSLFLNNIACIHMYKNEFDMAKSKLDSAFSIAYNNDNLETLSYIYSSYGEYYQGKKQFKLSESFYLKSIGLHRQLSHTEEVYQTNLLLSGLYEGMGNFKGALSLYKQHKIIQDSIIKINKSKLFHRQKFEQNLRQLEHSNKTQFLNQKRKDLYYIIFTISIFIFLLIILISIVFKRRIEGKKIQLSEENKSLKENLLMEKIENKNKELTSKAILLSERNDLIKNVSEKLNSCKSKLKQSNVEIIQNVINDLNSNVTEKQWDDFQQNFNSLHPMFYKELLSDFPTLSPKELKLCSFLKLNMTSKEIALVTHMTTNSVEVSRSRLRKKLNLSRSSLSLFVFLSRY